MNVTLHSKLLKKQESKRVLPCRKVMCSGFTPYFTAALCRASSSLFPQTQSSYHKVTVTPAGDRLTLARNMANDYTINTEKHYYGFYKAVVFCVYVGQIILSIY